MWKLIFNAQAEPVAPVWASKHTMYVDSSDSLLKMKDSSGNVRVVWWMALSSPTNFNVKIQNWNAIITWTDPDDLDTYPETIFVKSVLVRKNWSYPTSPTDWTVVVTETVKNTYKTSWYVDENIDMTDWVYYKLFTFSTWWIASCAEKKIEYRYMTLTIDESNNNPLTSVAYADDASTMTVWSTDWDTFFGYYPCLLDSSWNEYKIVKHDLSTNYVDWTKDIDNNDISSYVSWSSWEYNAMIAFPRLWVKMSKSWNTITVSLTDNPNAYDQGYHYLAHVNGALDLSNINTTTEAGLVKDKMYMWAYKWTITNSKLRSVASNAAPTVSQTRAAFRTAGTTMGTGYSQMGYYQLLFRQILYLFKYKNLNSQAALGRWYVDKTSSWAAVACWLTNSKNMLNYGLTTSWTDATNNRVVLFGIEDAWWNIWEWIDWFNLLSYVWYTNVNRSTWADDTSANYYNIWTATSTSWQYVTKMLWTTVWGFLPTANSWWSDTTYYSDYYWTNSWNRVLKAGGAWYNTDQVGVFTLYTSNASSSTDANVGGRLMFL